VAHCIPEQCRCDRGLPLIGTISGRTKNIVVGLNGRYLSHIFFAHYLKEYEEEIRKFQVIQEDFGIINIRIIPENFQKGLSKKSSKEITSYLKELLGEKTKINIELADDIETIKTGKHLSVISKVKIDFQRLCTH
jgi:phenylacetate-CoA ligase